MMNTNKARPADKKQTELLYLLMEECGEVIQACSKILRHGLDSRHPLEYLGDTNQQALEKEAGDVIASIELLRHAKVLRQSQLDRKAEEKLINVKKFLRYS